MFCMYEALGLIAGISMWFCLDFPGGSDRKESPCNVGDLVLSLRQEDRLEKEMATHSSTLAGGIP